MITAMDRTFTTPEMAISMFITKLISSGKIKLEQNDEGFKAVFSSPNAPNDPVGIEKRMRATIEVVESTLGLEKGALAAPSRKREFVQGRHIAMRFIMKYVRPSFKSCGAAFGGRDHSTVIHALHTYGDLYETSRDFKALADACNLELHTRFGIPR